MRGIFAVLGALSGAVVVATGAFAAHGLKDRLDAYALEVWGKAVHWQAIHAAALLLVAVAQRLDRETPGGAGAPRRLATAGVCFAAGTVLFSGSLYALALTGVRALGAVTPVGGVAWIAGWVAFAAAVWPRRS